MNIGEIGIVASVSLAAIGSALGIGIAGMATVGAWKKCYMQNKDAPFMLLIFIGAPLTQTLYGFILLIILSTTPAASELTKLVIGVLGGTAMGFSAFYQGKVGANGSDAFAETEKGFANYFIAVGLVESVALFVMVFLLITALGVFSV